MGGKTVSLGAACAAIAALVLAGSIAAAAVAGSVVSGPVLHFYRETGVALPAVLEIAIATKLPTLAIMYGIATAVAIAFAPRVGVSAPRSIGAGVVALAGALFLIIIAIVVVESHRRAIIALFERMDTGEREAVPGRAAEVAEQVVAAVDRGLRERAGVCALADGARAPFFFFEGPGVASKPPAGALDYAAIHALDGCVLLPYGRKRTSADEPIVLVPRARDLDLGPERLARDGPPRPPELAHVFNGMMRERFARVFAAGGDFGYALAWRRARIEGNVEDDLYELRIAIFRGFDEARAKEPTIPLENAPVCELIVLVAK